MWWWLLGWALAGADCEAPASRREVREAADAVWGALVDADPRALGEARASLAQVLPCAQERLTPVEAVAVHRARAAEAFADGDLEAVRRTLAAVSVLDPRWSLPPPLAGSHPMATLWGEGLQRASSPVRVTVDWAPAGDWWLDGLSRAGEPVVLPAGRAVVLQVSEGAEGFRHTGHHVTASTVPVAGLAPVRERPEVRAARRRRIRLATGVAGGVLAAAGVGLWASGLADASAIRRGDVPPEDVGRRQAAANARAGAGYGLTGAGALLVTVGLTVRW